ncbi:MAG: hypothetical protein MUC43_01115 [Pirellula sp.]|nr:hypothetical protein [Pirellula sp.]
MACSTAYTPKGLAQDGVPSGGRSLLVKEGAMPSKTEASQDESKTKAAKKTAAKPASTQIGASDESALRPVKKKELTETPSPMGGETFLLRYKFKPGLRIVSEVTHMAKTDNKIDATAQDADSRTVTHKTWDVTKVEDGNMTFEYMIDDIDMSQRIGTGDELRYSSKSGEQPPFQFQNAADSVGKVISTVTIDQQGLIVARSDQTNPPNLGMGDITLPVPENAVAVGATWEIPRELNVRREDGSFKRVRFRELFKLEKVSAGIATVSVASEMITIVSDPKEEAQVVQQLSNGTIKFDIDAGRMISKELVWDKKVVGFSGAGSTMEYTARLDERVISTDTIQPAARSAKK